MDRQATEDSLVSALSERRAMIAAKREYIAQWRSDFQRCEDDIERFRRKLSGEERQLELEGD